MNNDIDRAKAFCVAAHSAVGQLRKYTGEPYYTHPFAVAAMVQQHVPDCEVEQVVAALLHDVVEDTQVTLQVVQQQFGEKVARYVSHLTDVSPTLNPKGSRAARKELDRLHIARAPYEVKTIKLADLIHNTQSIAVHGSLEFARLYLQEKQALLEVLQDSDASLYELAQQSLDTALQLIAQRTPI